MNTSETPSDSVMVDLLDSSTGHTVQVWYLASQPVIKIGRDVDQDVVIADPYVSRQHAELRIQGGQWRLIALGRHGVLINGQRVTEAPASNGLRFRLGSEGPTLRFSDQQREASNSATITSDETVKIALHINAMKVEEEVSEIAGGEYFRQLQDRARQLRRNRDASRDC